MSSKLFFIPAIILILFPFSPSDLNAQAIVSNVRSAQRTDGSKIVDIYYDLSGTMTSAERLRIFYSIDGGNIYTEALSLTGHFGQNVPAGTNRYVVWNLGVEVPGVEKKCRMMIKVFDLWAGIPYVSIPGDTFQMGDVENVGLSSEKPVHTVLLSEFEMSVYEITNSQYAKYLNEALASGDVTTTSTSVKGAKGTYSGYEYLYISGSTGSSNKCWITYSNGTFSVVSGYENWPVVYVTWYGAKAFALYYGLDLPTESEWEYACRGDLQYKYGTDDGTISSTKANYYWGSGNIGHPIDVGSYTYNPFGLYDMSGNVWEWCHDKSGTYPSGSVNNPSGAQSGSGRVLRGGSWGYEVDNCRSANRNGINPDSRLPDLGFRVVRRVSPQNY